MITRFLTLVLLTVTLAIVAVLAVSSPDIRRYLRMRSMSIG
ncbi:MAG: hypothetical protein ABIP77_10560 [Candidatus Limnocylindrales bacterium]